MTWTFTADRMYDSPCGVGQESHRSWMPPEQCGYARNWRSATLPCLVRSRRTVMAIAVEGNRTDPGAKNPVPGGAATPAPAPEELTQRVPVAKVAKPDWR